MQVCLPVFDMMIRSPAVNPKTQVVLENKVELSLDDRSIESLQKYLGWLKSYKGTANFLVLNTKYSVPEGSEVPGDIVIIHWHLIAKKVKDFLISLLLLDCSSQQAPMAATG